MVLTYSRCGRIRIVIVIAVVKLIIQNIHKTLYKSREISRMIISKNFLIIREKSLKVNIVHIIGEGTKMKRKR